MNNLGFQVFESLHFQSKKINIQSFQKLFLTNISNSVGFVFVPLVNPQNYLEYFKTKSSTCEAIQQKNPFRISLSNSKTLTIKFVFDKFCGKNLVGIGAKHLL